MLPALPEKLLYDFSRFAGQHSSPHLHPVVEAGVIDDLQHGMNRPCFGVVGAVHQAADAGVNQRTGTHGAWLNRSEECAFAQPMITEVLSGFAQGDDFGVGGGVILGKVTIPAAADDLPVLDDDGADRYFAGVECALGGAEGFLHPEFIGLELKGREQLKPAFGGSRARAEAMKKSQPGATLFYRGGSNDGICCPADRRRVGKFVLTMFFGCE